MITKEVIDACPNMRYIGLFATGFNNIDIEYAAKKGITVCNAGEYSTNAVAQQVFAYILDHCNRIRDYGAAVKDGAWERSPSFSYFPIPTAELAGKTLSVVGYGSIGRRATHLADAFGMNVVVSTRTAPNREKLHYNATHGMGSIRNQKPPCGHCLRQYKSVDRRKSTEQSKLKEVRS